MHILFTDLKATPIKKVKRKIRNYDLEYATKQLIESFQPYLTDWNNIYKPIGLVGIGVGIHGIVNNENKTFLHQQFNGPKMLANIRIFLAE